MIPINNIKNKNSVKFKIINMCGILYIENEFMNELIKFP